MASRKDLNSLACPERIYNVEQMENESQCGNYLTEVYLQNIL